MHLVSLNNVKNLNVVLAGDRNIQVANQASKLIYKQILAFITYWRLLIWSWPIPMLLTKLGLSTTDSIYFLLIITQVYSLPLIVLSFPPSSSTVSL